MTDRIIENIGELIVGPGDGETLRRYQDGALVISDGRVVATGPAETLTRKYPPENAEDVLDASGQLVTPGFVDPHTHALFAGDRSHEFIARLEGKTYTEIMNDGGGIPVTVEAVNAASEEDLLENLLDELDVMLAHGTTTAEVKSGYGLDPETERKMVSVIARADEAHPIDLVATFMGAHAVPEEQETEAYVESVIETQLPVIGEQGIAEFCDVFCESGVFDVDQSRRILEAGRDYGLEPKLHAEEFSRIGGAQLAADIDATSADHLLQATDSDIQALVDAGVTPVLLPATAFSLDEPYADAAAFLEAGAPVAVGSDLNPSCFVHNMGFVVSLACLRMKMKPAKAVLAATANAARAIGRREGVGTLAEGTTADVVFFDLPDHVHIPYNAGTNRVETVLKAGNVVYQSNPTDRRGGQSLIGVTDSRDDTQSGENE